MGSNEGKNEVEAYLAGFTGEARARLDQIRALLREIIPGADERISYGIPTFDLGGRHVIHFAGFQRHVGLYPTPQGIAAFEADLAPFVQGKGSVQFPLDQPLPVALIEKVARYQLERTLAQPPKKRPKTTSD